MGEYISRAPIDDDAKRYNQNLPGMGGIFNVVNMHCYHYAGNNPVKLTDPDGKNFYNFSDKPVTVILENSGKGVIVNPGEMYAGPIDGVVLFDDNNNPTTIIKVTYKEGFGSIVHLSLENIDGVNVAFVIGGKSRITNSIGDFAKKVDNLNIFGKGFLLSGIYNNWKESIDNKTRNNSNVRPMTDTDVDFAKDISRVRLQDRDIKPIKMEPLPDQPSMPKHEPVKKFEQFTGPGSSTWLYNH